jgi:hypothetical protein
MDWQPAPIEGFFFAKSFAFLGGRMDMRLAYQTLGTPAPDRGNAVLLLHGTSGSGRQFLQPAFAGAMFGPGGPLDARSYSSFCPTLSHSGGVAHFPSRSHRAALPGWQKRMTSELIGACPHSGEELDYVADRTSFTDARKNTRNAVDVYLKVHVGHGVGCKSNVEASFVGLPRSHLNPRPGSDARHNDLSHLLVSKPVEQRRRGESAGRTLCDAMIVGRHVQTGHQLGPARLTRAEPNYVLFASPPRDPVVVHQHDGQATQPERIS